MAAFATVDDLNTWFDSERVTDTEVKEIALEAASRYLRRSTGRDFAVAGDASARTFVPPYKSSVLNIDDCTSIASVVENGATLTAGVQYVAYPLNGRTLDGEAVPYDQLYRYDAWWWWDDIKPTVTVTATWGWVATPDAIKQATLALAKIYLDSRNEQGGIAAITEVGISRSVDSKLIRDAIRDYRGPKSVLVA